MNQVAVAANETAKLPVVEVRNEFIAMIERMVTNKDVDIVKLNALRDIYNDEQDRAAEKAFYADFVRMKPMLPRVIKLHDNEQTKSKYAKLEDINDIIEPILGNFGFGTSMEILDQTDVGVSVRVDLIHTAGFIKSTPVFMPWDDKGMAGAKNKTMPHAYASSIMYARRVGECLLLNISTGNDKDGNSATGGNAVIDTEQAATLDTLIRETDANRKGFLDYFKVDDVRNIKNSDYQKALKMLNKKAKNAKKAEAA
jgi:hypothetical protein